MICLKCDRCEKKSEYGVNDYEATKSDISIICNGVAIRKTICSKCKVYFGFGDDTRGLSDPDLVAQMFFEVLEDLINNKIEEKEL